MISILPREILSQIFSHLTLSDQLQCNLVCQQWHWAFLDPNLHDGKTVLKFANDEVFLQSLDLLLKSDVTQAIRHLAFEKINVNLFSVRPIQDWSLVLSKIRFLTLIDASIASELELVQLLKSTANLNGLRINYARDIFISGGFLSSQSDREELRSVLSKVCFLDLSVNSPYLTDQIFNRITYCTPNVSDLVLDNTKILNHSGIYKKHYPASVVSFDSPSVLTWRNIFRYLVENAENFKSLSFYNSGIPSSGLIDLSHSEKLRLLALNIGKCSDITLGKVLNSHIK